MDIGSQRTINWPDMDVLCVAGDVANSIGEVVKFFEKFNKQRLRAEKPLVPIYYVDGNHEHYSNASQERSVTQTIRRLMDLLPENVNLLTQDSNGGLTNGFYFVGVNGWYSMDPVSEGMLWRQSMNDCRWIGFDKFEGPPMPWEWAEQQAEWLANRLERIVEFDPEAKIVVMTHTSPHVATLSLRPEYMATNPFYINKHMTPVLERFSKNIRYWQHGHTHFRQFKEVDGVQLVVNPRGYPYENPNWEPVVLDL